MPKDIGDNVEARANTIGLPDPNDATSVGDVLALDADGNCVPYDGDSHSSVVGVRAKGAKSGDNIPVTVHGAIVASAASGIAAGAGAGGGNATDGTTGAFASGGSRGTVLCDEGGSYKGSDIASGAAVVDLR